jgi:two-component system, cell cycle sensor histidine kinase and response regulator CckA
MEKARLLVVDGEDLVRVLMARILRDRGYDVVEAANGRVALELLEAAGAPHFDLVVTNSRLPGLGGPQLIEEVLAKYPRLRVLHVSGHPESIEDPRIRGLGIPTLEKPFASKELSDAVQQCLEEKRQPNRAAAFGDSVAEGSPS